MSGASEAARWLPCKRSPHPAHRAAKRPRNLPQPENLQSARRSRSGGSCGRRIWKSLLKRGPMPRLSLAPRLVRGSGSRRSYSSALAAERGVTERMFFCVVSAGAFLPAILADGV